MKILWISLCMCCVGNKLYTHIIQKTLNQSEWSDIQRHTQRHPTTQAFTKSKQNRQQTHTQVHRGFNEL